MKLIIYRSHQHQPADVPANKGLHEIEGLLKLLERRGIKKEDIDVDPLSVEEIQKAYSDAVVPSVSKKFGIRRVFGSRRRSGSLFGREVPALLVYEEGKPYPSDVYPHDEGQGKVITIREFLYSLQTELLVGKVAS